MFISVATDGNHQISWDIGQSADEFGSLAGNIDPSFAQHPNRLWGHSMAGSYFTGRLQGRFTRTSSA
jgi:hypothetical protein